MLDALRAFNDENDTLNWNGLATYLDEPQMLDSRGTVETQIIGMDSMSFTLKLKCSVQAAIEHQKTMDRRKTKKDFAVEIHHRVLDLTPVFLYPKLINRNY